MYYDKEHTIPFDDSRTHPGGEGSFGVKLYVEYIEGVYRVVENASQLVAARSQNIYLLNDIDMDGKSIRFDNFNGKTFLGNGHKVYNFKLDYSKERGDLSEDFAPDATKKSLCIALFGNVENAKVKDVTFEDFTVTVDFWNYNDAYRIYVAPLAVNATGSTFENVTVKASVGYTQETDRQVSSGNMELVIATDKAYFNGENSSESGCSYEIENVGLVTK